MKTLILTPLVATATLHGALTFNISDQADDPNAPAILESIEFGGILHSDFIAPSSWENVNLTGESLVRENSQILSTLGDTDFASLASGVMASDNLNAFLQLDDNTFGQTYQVNFQAQSTLLPGADYIVVITERGLNNSTQIEAFDFLDNSVGTRDVLASEYVDTGVESLIKPGRDELNQNIGATAFLLSDFVDISEDTVSYLQFTNTDSNDDGADGKVFLFRVVPEPSTSALLALACLAVSRRKR